MFWSDEMLWAIDRLTNMAYKVKNDIFLTWELVLKYWKPRCGRSPTERLRWTLKALIESNLTIRAWTRNLHWPGKKVLSKTENFRVIPGQREVYHATRRRDRFQPTTDDISRYFGRRTTAAEAGRIWIDGSHYYAYAFVSLLSCLLCQKRTIKCIVSQPLPGCGRKKWTPKFFRRFLSNRLGFWHEIVQLYAVKPSTFNCQVKCDFVEKRWSYRLFNMIAYRFFGVQKCSC